MRVSDIFAYRRKPKQRNYRYDIFARDDYECWYCGRDLSSVDAISCNAEITIDHKYPQAQGGDESNENLVTCCRPCNLMKGNRTIEEFREVLTFRAIKGIVQARHNLTKASRYLSQDIEFLVIMSTLNDLEEQILALRVTFYGESSPLPLPEEMPEIQVETEYPQ